MGDTQSAAFKPVGAVALMEISSNTISFTVEYLDDDLSKARYQDKYKAGLGKYSEGTKDLNPDGVEEAIAKIKLWKANFLDKTNFERVRIIGTGALRDADNAQAFIDRVKKETGLDIDVIDGKEEARLAAKGVQTVYEDACGLVIDQGGRSCEFSLIDKNRNIIARKSLDLGAYDILEQGNAKKQNRYIEKQLKTLPNAFKDKIYDALYVVGGGPKNFLDSFMKAAEFKGHMHEFTAKADDLNGHATKVARAKSANSLTKKFGIAADRTETAPATARLIRNVNKFFDIETVQGSKAGIREGAIAEMKSEAIATQRQALIHSVDPDALPGASVG